MISNKFNRNLSVFQSCDAEYDESDVVIFSSPMDATCSFRPGTRFAGPAIELILLALNGIHHTWKWI